MPPLARQRAAATAVAALFVAAPLLTATAAAAAPVESGKEVVFSGERGLLGVACEANPSASTVTVPAETTLRVVNQTGYRAKLQIDGATQGEIENGGAAPVVFHRGPVTLGLKPSCMLADESAVRVEVVAAPRTAAPGATPGTSAPGQPATGGARSPDEERPEPAASATPAASPSPTEEASPEPGIAAVDGGASAAAVDTVDETTGAGTEGAAAEVLSSVQPVRENGPIGLLALIATVCVIGVLSGAIRAIIAQRATRTGVA